MSWLLPLTLPKAPSTMKSAKSAQTGWRFQTGDFRLYAGMLVSYDRHNSAGQLQQAASDRFLKGKLGQ